MTLDPAVRQQIADALESASVETLREWAQWCSTWASGAEADHKTRSYEPHLRAQAEWHIRAHRGLAALAIAVAAMQERAVYVVPADNPDGAADVPAWQAYAIGQGVAHVHGPTLTAALAHLVRGGA